MVLVIKVTKRGRVMILKFVNHAYGCIFVVGKAGAIKAVVPCNIQG